MKRSKYIFFFILLALLSGCEGNSPEQGEPSIILESTQIDVPAQGGTFSINYSIENPVEGGKLIVTPQYQWVYDLDISTTGVITFSVSESYLEESRSCKVELSYPGVYPNPIITVNQSEGLEHSFTFNVQEVTHTTIKVDVLPLDKEQPYVMLLGYKDYIDEHGFMEDDEGLIESDLETFESFANAMGGDVASVMSAFMYEGDQIGYTFTNVVPNTEYLLYAYGFDKETMSPTSEVSRVVIRTLEVEEYVVDFEFDVQVSGADVNIDIEALAYDGPFFFDILYADDLPEGSSEEEIKEVCSGVWEEWKNYHISYGFEISDVLNILAYKKEAHWEGSLPYNEEYVVFAFAMNESAIMNSVPKLCYFSTSDVVPSDNVIELSATDVYSRKATVNVSPSNDDGYVALVEPVQKFLGMSDEEIIEYVTTNMNVSVVSGPFSQEVSGLRPALEYEILAFGYEGGCATTSLFRSTFTTLESVYADAVFELKYDKFYDIEEIVAIESNWNTHLNYQLVLPVEAVVDGEYENIYYAVMLEEDYYRYDEEDIATSLFANGACELSSLLFLDYGLSFVIVGMAEDSRGDYSELWVSKPTTFKYEDTSDAQEFVDNYLSVPESSGFLYKENSLLIVE